MQSCYFVDHDFRDCVDFVDHDLRDRVNFVGPGFEPRTKHRDIFIGPGFNSQARSPISGQCDPWPMSLTPTNGELG